MNELATLLDRLSTAAETEATTAAEANDLVATLERLNTTFSERHDIILR